MKVKVLNKDGSDSGREIVLDDAIFGIEPKDQLIYEDVRSYLANQRQGNASTKGRSQIRGGGRKAYRQKGTGMARRGTIRSPLLKGGGTVFGPKPRDYVVRMTKKMKSLARMSAFAYKAKEEGILVMEDFSFDEPNTKAFVDILKAINSEGKKVLFLTNGTQKIIYKSGRNIPKVQILEANKPATYTIMNADVIVIQEGAVSQLENSLKRNPEEVEA